MVYAINTFFDRLLEILLTLKSWYNAVKVVMIGDEVEKAKD